MPSKNELAAAELAGLVGGHLNSVKKMITVESSTDSSNTINPTQFLKHGINRSNKQTTNNNIIPKNAMIKEPKSKPNGSEILGTENVNLEELLIPMDGADEKMRKAIAVHSHAAQTHQMPHPPTAPVVGNVTPLKNENNMSPSGEVIELLKDINKKLDLILKRAKIQPRYKKGKNK